MEVDVTKVEVVVVSKDEEHPSALQQQTRRRSKAELVQSKAELAEYKQRVSAGLNEGNEESISAYERQIDFSASASCA